MATQTMAIRTVYSNEQKRMDAAIMLPLVPVDKTKGGLNSSSKLMPSNDRFNIITTYKMYLIMRKLANHSKWPSFMTRVSGLKYQNRTSWPNTRVKHIILTQNLGQNLNWNLELQEKVLHSFQFINAYIEDSASRFCSTDDDVMIVLSPLAPALLPPWTKK